jgi:pimeloyl-ACP methyl ester carboxylesterase
MKTVFHVSVVLVLLLATLLIPSTPVVHAESTGCDPDGVQNSGAIYRICMPADGWNGDLVLYAHGYVAFNEPIAIPEDQLSLPGGPSLPEIITGLGYAFAVTSYSVNGLAIREGLDDLRELVDIFSSYYGQPKRVYLVGPSEGGIITALAIERYPDIYDAGISACGPVGNFQAQINYWGDVRVLFEYFFPSLLPGTAIFVPDEVIEEWETIYEPKIEAALRAHPAERQQLLATARIPHNPANEEESIRAILGLLWYNVFATNDGIEKLGGQPYSNRWRIYRGSEDDTRLNQQVGRYTADPAAVAEMQSFYQTTGSLARPLVMIHTIDPIIPAWHPAIYWVKVAASNSQTRHTYLPFLGRYGHCDFSVPQVLLSFVIMVRQATGATIADAERVLTTEEQRAEYRELEQLHLEVEGSFYKLYIPSVRSNGQ